MRVLFTPFAMPSHYYPMVGLLSAFRAAGHDVRVAAQPGVVDAVIRSGVSAVAVGGQYDVMAGFAEAKAQATQAAAARSGTEPGASATPPLSPGEELAVLGPADLRRVGQLRMRKHTLLARDMAADLVAFARWWRPQLVVTDPLVYAAPLAAAAAGAPLVRHLWGVEALRQVGFPGHGVDPIDDPRATWPDDLVELYAGYGVEPRVDVAERTVDICPASMQVSGVPNRMPLRFVPYNGAAVVPRWLFQPLDRPRICVTSGNATTAVLGASRFVVPQVLGALTGFDLDLVVAVSPADRGRLTNVPAGVRVVAALPLDLVLPTCAAVLHHAGAGSTLTAAVHGVPQVTVPQLPGGQDLISEQLAGTGAGIHVKTPEPDVVAAAVRAVLSDDGPREAARRLRDEMRAQPAPADVVRALEC